MPIPQEIGTSGTSRDYGDRMNFVMDRQRKFARIVLSAIASPTHQHELIPTTQKFPRDSETAAAVQLCGAIGASCVVPAEFRVWRSRQGH
jgi:hypothetical protein